MSESSYVLLGLALGLAAGFVLGWLIAWKRATRQTREEWIPLEQELRKQLQEHHSQSIRISSELQSALTAHAAADAKAIALQGSLEEQNVLHARTLRTLEDTRKETVQELQQAFSSLSAQALIQTQPEFIRLASQTLERFQEQSKSELLQRQEAISGLVQPLKEQVQGYQARLQASESAAAQAFGELKQHIEFLSQHSQTLSLETMQLRKVLSSSQARGQWGELTLRRVIEASGMSPHCDFSEQTQQGESKPDLIIHLPGNRSILVDAKVPEVESLGTLDQAEPGSRERLLQAHAAKLRTTVKALSDREYPEEFREALDVVVLFVPAESILSAALEADPDLLVWSHQKRILLATPSSLLAILRAVAIGWQQQAQTENARAIADAAQELYGRICTFLGHLEKLRGSLERSVQAYNETVGSFERAVRPSGERLRRLGAATTDKDLPELERIDTSLRASPMAPAEHEPGC